MKGLDIGFPHELDLHGLSWNEALPAFIAFYNEVVLNGSEGNGNMLNVIHGYGSGGVGGVLRKRLRRFLEEQGRQGVLEFTPGEHIDANPGHTVVQPVQHLPDLIELLAEEIIVYCDRPRPLSKIAGKFRRNGEPAVKSAVDNLVRQGRIRVVGKGSRKMYELIV